MRIINKGSMEKVTYCDNCNTEFAFTKSDVFFVHRSEKIPYIDGDGDKRYDLNSWTEYHVHCPCCNHSEDVGYLVSAWFE